MMWPTLGSRKAKEQNLLKMYFIIIPMYVIIREIIPGR